MNIFDYLVRPGMKMLLEGRITPVEICRPKTLRYIFFRKYLNMCKSGNLLPIEAISQDAKRHYWREAQAVGEDHQLRIDAACIIYLIDNIAEEYDRWRADELRAQGAGI